MMEQDDGRSGADAPSGHSAKPEPVCAVSAADAASVPNADDVAQAAAALIQPELFAPFVRRFVDDAYEKLMDSVQDYLIENAGYNIASRISLAENEARRFREELLGIDRALGRRWSDPESRTDLIALLTTRHSDGADTRRLDWLDKVNTRTNARNGNRYGWRYDINHNRAALTDCNAPYRPIRQAIDDAMIASGIEAQSDETPQAAQPEGQEPGPKGDANV